MKLKCNFEKRYLCKESSNVETIAFYTSVIGGTIHWQNEFVVQNLAILFFFNIVIYT